MALRNAFENLATDRKLDNPMPVEMAGLFKRLFGIFGRFSFDEAARLRTTVSGSVSISGTPTTTGNIGIGDWSKNATGMQQSQQSFMGGIRRNFSRT